MDHEKATPQELRWRIAQLEARLAEQVRINTDITESTIWRATAPLRKWLGPLSELKRRVTGIKSVPASGFKPPVISHQDDGGPLSKQPWIAGVSRHCFQIEFVWNDVEILGGKSSLHDSFNNAIGIRHINLYDDEAISQAPLVKINFMRRGNSAAFKVFGFMTHEIWGVWTHGRRSQLLLWSPDTTSNKLRLEISGGMRHASDQNAPPLIIINGEDFGLLKFSQTGVANIQLPINRELQSGALRNDYAKIANNVSTYEYEKPFISVIILNFNKPYLTYLTITALIRAKTNLLFEIIVLDNGSEAQNASVIPNMDLPIRWIRLDENRYFGEGNNIAAEMARSETLLFLNNDVFVYDFILDRLYESLNSSDKIGATGPILFYPDGTLQEAGAFIAKDGSVYQRGKGTTQFDFSILNDVSDVDYISAACLMVRKRHFLELGGFDLRYDPAYYEDSDLCLRLLSRGLKTVLVKNAHVTHIENATTADADISIFSANLTERHKVVFLTRWQKWLQSRDDCDLPEVASFNVEATSYKTKNLEAATTINAVFTPYALSPGGGERYLLSAALAMAPDSDLTVITIVTPTLYSHCRINTLCRELGIKSDRLIPVALQQAASRYVGRYIHMGNEVFPSAPGLGAFNVFHCQFPFPGHLPVPTPEIGLSYLSTYSIIIVNSHFTRNAYLKALAKFTNVKKDVRVIYPPIQLVSSAVASKAIAKEKLILSIGRFTLAGHAKRQDLILAAFKDLTVSRKLTGWRLVLCGNVPNDAQSSAYYNQLKQDAAGYDVKFMLSPDREQLDDLYRQASIYVSAAGTGITNPRDFYKCEHFGITIVEAMSANCIVVAADTGGPAEILNAMNSGLLFTNQSDLGQKLMDAAAITEKNVVVVDRDNLMRLYSEQTFVAAWREIWEEQSTNI